MTLRRLANLFEDGRLGQQAQGDESERGDRGDNAKGELHLNLLVRFPMGKG